MEEGTVYEDIIRLRARRLGAVALLLYAVGTLITVVGVAAGLAIILSSVPSGLSMPTTPEAARAIAGVVLMAIGFIFYVYFALYAGFKGRGVVSRTDLSGWGVVVKNLGRLYFIATLLVAIGIIVIPGTSFLYSTAIIFLVSSALFMVSAYLAPSLQRSITAGIILIIASITTIVGVRAGIPGFLGQVPGISQITSLPLTYGLLSAIAFMIVGVALIVRGNGPASAHPRHYCGRRWNGVRFRSRLHTVLDSLNPIGALVISIMASTSRIPTTAENYWSG